VVAGPELELPADQPQLAKLCVGERLVPMLEDGARVRQRLVEEEREELVAEVVVVADVPAGGERAGTAVEPRPQLGEAAQVRMTRRRSLGVPDQELEQPGQVVGAPLARLVGLAQPEPRPGGEPAEEGVVDRHPNRGPEPNDISAPSAGGQKRPPRASADSLERPHGDAVHERDAAAGSSRRASTLMSARSFRSKGGFLWNGTA
jgi:hypothetical protein